MHVNLMSTFLAACSSMFPDWFRAGAGESPRLWPNHEAEIPGGN